MLNLCLIVSIIILLAVLIGGCWKYFKFYLIFSYCSSKKYKNAKKRKKKKNNIMNK